MPNEREGVRASTSSPAEAPKALNFVLHLGLAFLSYPRVVTASEALQAQGLCRFCSAVKSSKALNLSLWAGISELKSPWLPQLGLLHLLAWWSLNFLDLQAGNTSTRSRLSRMYGNRPSWLLTTMTVVMTLEILMVCGSMARMAMREIGMENPLRMFIAAIAFCWQRALAT